MQRRNNKATTITGAVLAGLFTGILVGYILGVNRRVADDELLSSWVNDHGNYEDGNVFGYETGLPEGFHSNDKPDKKVKPQKGSLK